MLHALDIPELHLLLCRVNIHRHIARRPWQSKHLLVSPSIRIKAGVAHMLSQSRVNAPWILSAVHPLRFSLKHFWTRNISSARAECSFGGLSNAFSRRLVHIPSVALSAAFSRHFSTKSLRNLRHRSSCPPYESSVFFTEAYLDDSMSRSPCRP